jgi:hypothetical protein
MPASSTSPDRPIDSAFQPASNTDTGSSSIATCLPECRSSRQRRRPEAIAFFPDVAIASMPKPEEKLQRSALYVLSGPKPYPGQRRWKKDGFSTKPVNHESIYVRAKITPEELRIVIQKYPGDPSLANSYPAHVPPAAYRSGRWTARASPWVQCRGRLRPATLPPPHITPSGSGIHRAPLQRRARQGMPRHRCRSMFFPWYPCEPVLPSERRRISWQKNVRRVFVSSDRWTIRGEFPIGRMESARLALVCVRITKSFLFG